MIRKAVRAFAATAVVALASMPASGAPQSLLFACSTPASPVTPPSGISVEVSVPKTSFAAGEDIPVTVTVANTGASTVHNIRPDGQEFDIWATDEDGDLVWQWSYGLGFFSAVEEEDFAPGSPESRTVSWNQRRCGDSSYLYGPVGRPPCTDLTCATGVLHLRALWRSTSGDPAWHSGGWWSPPVTITIGSHGLLVR